MQSLATELRSGPSSDPSQIVENGEEMLAVGALKVLLFDFVVRELSFFT